MDLNTITSVKRPADQAEITDWNDGCAWLAGGTWLFSEPQLGTDTLIDLHGLNWPALAVGPHGLDIAATCRIIELDHFVPPPGWIAGPLISLCCRSLLASFKVMNAATVGGNICMSLPAGALTALCVALDGSYTLLSRGGGTREVAAADFVTGNHLNVLAPGELLRNIHLPATALSRRFAWRRSSLTHLGRSAALLIGTRDGDALSLTVTAATPRPVQLRFDGWPDADGLRRAIAAAIADDGWFDDVNGTPAYKRHLTYRFAEQIRLELSDGDLPETSQ
jgi:CO/xanthine dehydrogenase FAD-binding subunit